MCIFNCICVYVYSRSEYWTVFFFFFASQTLHPKKNPKKNLGEWVGVWDGWMGDDREVVVVREEEELEMEKGHCFYTTF